MKRIHSVIGNLKPKKTKTQKQIDQQALIGTNSDLPKYRILPNLRFAYALPLLIIFAGFGMHSIFGGKAAPVTANIWIDSDGGTCSFSQQDATYNSANACRTVQDALNAIGSGKGNTAVKVIAGAYPGQTVADDSRASTDRVTFNEYGGEASFEYLDFHGDNVTFESFTFNRPYRTVDYQEGVSVVGSSTQSKGVILKNNVIQGGVYLSNTDGVQVKGGEICCTMASPTHDQKVLTTNGGPGMYVYNTVIDGVKIHDARRTDASVHSECARVYYQEFPLL